MSFIILAIGILLLILFITWAKLNAFISFIIVCLFVGLTNGMQIGAISASIQKGMGDLLGSLVIIIGLGAMLGKLVAESGAAETIAKGLIRFSGEKNLAWALLLTSFIIGIPLFYNVGFVIILPLAISIAIKYKIPPVYLGLPALSAMSVTHGFLPPHPSPTALVQQFHADLGLTLLYGFIVAVPCIILAGPVFAKTLKKYNNRPLESFIPPPKDEASLPGMFLSIFSAFLPVILISAATITDILVKQDTFPKKIIMGLGDPVMAMLVTVLFSMYSLGLRQGRTMTQIGNSLADAVKDIAVILFIIGGAGSLKEVLLDTGISGQIATSLQSIHINPLMAAWSIAAVIRLAIGSATVAGLTTAGIVAPLIVTSGANPNLMVLATGAGSLFFSHVNDSGFWLFKEYFNLSIKQTMKTWSMMETIVSVVGIIAVLILSYFVH
ncbi:gluconate transporter [Panacibacter ginsenosidivorans]|uniref:Gluconate transporter n=1 Tax=Panacibacter ginsenosidivorans TaxID=1813871 RepID=A0A5B8VGF4_9BACT|nr:gluconate:H+ symporter [Panacibacter ginsenosidivorans]QEC69656.1 gluconate transporter [Panacibacter ginsenosidivorans]